MVRCSLPRLTHRVHLNFLGHDSEADDALIDLVASAMDGRLDLRVTEQAFEEVGRTSEEATREQRLSRLRTFGRVELAAHRVGERDDLSERLKAAVFPAYPSRFADRRTQ